MNKPTKPSANLPSSFGGTKTNFNSTKIANGYEANVKDILGGANLNYLLDTAGKRQTYYDAICDFINAIPIGKTIVVNSSNQLVYENFSTVAKTGSYTDLTDKPTIPSIDNLANKDLSNLTTTGNDKFDGAWANNNGANITLSRGTSRQNYDIDISSYISNDGYSYQLLMQLFPQRTDAGNDNTSIEVYDRASSDSDKKRYGFINMQGGTSSSDTIMDVQDFVLILPANSRTISMTITGGNHNLSDNYLSLINWRRLGV